MGNKVVEFCGPNAIDELRSFIEPRLLCHRDILARATAYDDLSKEYTMYVSPLPGLWERVIGFRVTETPTGDILVPITEPVKRDD